MASIAKHPTVWDLVYWKTSLGEWRCGEYLGFANYTDTGGRTHVLVLAWHFGLVYAALDDLSVFPGENLESL